MNRIEFSIPGKPVAKGRPRSSARFGVARMYTDPKDLAREALVRQIAREAMAGCPPFPWAVRVTIDAVFEITASWPSAQRSAARANRHHIARPDADNIAKSILDGLIPAKDDDELAALFDDTQVAELVIRKRYGDPARTEVRIEALEACAPYPPRPAPKVTEKPKKGRRAAKSPPASEPPRDRRLL